MPKRRWNLNTIYISERLQECFRPISRCALTTVVAPMGYGKTTAVNRYLSERMKAENAAVIRINIYSDNLTIFWKSVQEAFSRAGLEFLRDYACPSDRAGAGLMADDLCHALAGQKRYYIFIDDLHLLTDNRVVDFICILTGRLPENVHLIAASRDRFLPGSEVVRLGGRVYQIGVEHLRLNHTELSVYAHRCGVDLSDEQIEALLHSTEGWFSAVYLNLCTFSECGELPGSSSDIYEMFSAAMIDPLPVKRREFIAVMGLADEFTEEMAQFITENENTGNMLSFMTEHNAFVSRQPDGATFRFHHMMKACAERAFSALKPEKQCLYLERYGKWYESHGQFLYALAAYERGENYDAALRVIQNDAGILLASLKPEDVLELLAQCPQYVLKDHPLALLVLMRRMFTWRQIPKMMELKSILMESIQEHREMSEEERGNLLGECDLIMSFLMYNDISQMSRLHRSACAQMSRPAISIRNEGSWTFGSPSVLMMFHREPGLLSTELVEIDECMPYYYKVTNGHGQGAELVMDAEAAFMQGRLADAQILLERAHAGISESRQENMALCCDFLARRLSLLMDIEERYDLVQKRKELMAQHDMMWINIFNSTCAYYYALLGRMEQIPALFGEHILSSVNFLAPCRPMMEMIENQVYLAQGAYAKVIGRSEGLLGMCDRHHYALVALHIRIQTAAAYEMLGKRQEAWKLLDQAIRDAVPDGILMPFVENYRYLRQLLVCRSDGETDGVIGRTAGPGEADGFVGRSARVGEADGFTDRIVGLGEAYEARCGLLREEESCPAALKELTVREREIVRLIAAHLTNREIAKKLYLSEGTVKQYINQIYAKLQIVGDTRTKRKQLLGLIGHNP